MLHTSAPSKLCLLRFMAKERERYYLLPGMGGKAWQRKRRTMLQWSIVAGVFVSIAVAGVLYLLYDRSPK